MVVGWTRPYGPNKRYANNNNKRMSLNYCCFSTFRPFPTREEVFRLMSDRWLCDEHGHMANERYHDNNNKRTSSNYCFLATFRPFPPSPTANERRFQIDEWQTFVMNTAIWQTNDIMTITINARHLLEALFPPLCVQRHQISFWHVYLSLIIHRRNRFCR